MYVCVFVYCSSSSLVSLLYSFSNRMAWAFNFLILSQIFIKLANENVVDIFDNDFEII